jgi:hypothetical protein
MVARGIKESFDRALWDVVGYAYANRSAGRRGKEQLGTDLLRTGLERPRK